MINNEESYFLALKRVEELWNCLPETPEELELADLINEIVDYEEQHHSI